jgi:hypothetical protein
VEIAVISVRVVKGAPDRVVDVVPVRHRHVAARVAVHVRTLDRRARVRPAPVHVEAVLVRVGAVRRVQVPVVEVVGMVAMAHLAVAAAGAVLVLVVVVGGAGHAKLSCAILSPRS